MPQKSAGYNESGEDGRDLGDSTLNEEEFNILVNLNASVANDHASIVLNALQQARTQRDAMQFQDLPGFDDVSPFFNMRPIVAGSKILTYKAPASRIPIRSKAANNDIRRNGTQGVPKYRSVIGLDENMLVKDSSKPFHQPSIEDGMSTKEIKAVDELCKFNQNYFEAPPLRGFMKETSLILSAYVKEWKRRGEFPGTNIEGFSSEFKRIFGIDPKDLPTQEGGDEKKITSEESCHPIKIESYYGLECDVCNQHECEKHGRYVIPLDDSEEEPEGGMLSGGHTEYVRVSAPFDAIVARRRERVARDFTRRREIVTYEPCSATCGLIPSEDERMEDSGYSTFQPLTKEEIATIEEFDQRMVLDGGSAACIISSLIGKPCRQVREVLLFRRPLTPVSMIPREDRKLPWYDNKKKQITKPDWAGKTNTNNHHERGQPQGCYHPGFQCGRTEGTGYKCICAQGSILCDKLCGCPDDCYLRHTGCNCQQSCSNSKTCPCWLLNRECIPDLCHSHNGKQAKARSLCSNNAIQLKLGKRILIGENEVIGGLGGYIAESAAEGDFIAEYTGEIITNWEREVRAKYYDSPFVSCSYIFTLNKDCAIDAWRYGNKTRYINHPQKSDQNIEAKVLLVDGAYRIGFYANRAIKPGEELLFHYGGDFTQQLKSSQEVERIVNEGNAKRKSANTPSRRTNSKSGTRKRIIDDQDEAGEEYQEPETDSPALATDDEELARVRKKSRRSRKSAAMPRRSRQ